MRGNVVAQCLLLDCCAVAGRWADALSIFEHLEPSKELWWVKKVGRHREIDGKSMNIKVSFRMRKAPACVDLKTFFLSRSH